AVRQITTVTGCSVEGCRNTTEDGIIFKSTPKNPCTYLHYTYVTSPVRNE
ncbi:unnamed protein product, partial [Tenebrio molitor]